MIRTLYTMRVCVSLTLIAAFLFPSCVAVTRRGCAQHQPSDNDMDVALGAMQRHSNRMRTSNATRTNTVVIKTYWHTVTSGNQGTISDKVIKDSIEVINKAFAPDFSFELVKQTVTDNPKYWEIDIDSKGEESMKKKLHEGGCGALNIYSTDLVSGLLGWATFPNWCKSSINDDGVVILYSSSPGVNKNGPHNGGHTLTHEVGHWLGLFHTFQGGCSSGKYSGDQVADTPEVRSYNTGCPKNTDSCPNDKQGPDMVNNFMDYTDDSCMSAFTRGQRERMIVFWDEYRAGDDPPSAPTKNTKPTKPPTTNNKPTDKPTKKPKKTNEPTKKPTKTNAPTKKPTKKNEPTKKPTKTNAPTKKPTKKNAPTEKPTKKNAPTEKPTKKNAPTKKPTTNKPTKPSVKPPGKCLKNQIELKVVIQTDQFAVHDNNRFFLRKKKNKRYEKKMIFYTKGLKDRQKKTYRTCLPKNECYKFTIIDNFGDGICCENGQGWYEIFKNDVSFTKRKFEDGEQDIVLFCTPRN